MRAKIGIFLAFALCSFAIHAGGVGLGATRMIYSSSISQSMLQVRNTHTEASFLIQSWIENDRGERTNDFVITPPLYVLKPAGESVVKILFSGNALPQDRETLYWMTVKAIPQQNKESAGNSLQFASANRIKIFYRPVRLHGEAGEAGRKITGRFHAGNITLTNPTPYYITTINVSVDGKAVQPVMIPPKGGVTLSESFNGAKNFSYQTINDYGAWTPVTLSPLHQ